MGFFSFIVLLAIAYLIWRVTDQLPDLIFRLSEIQRDVAEIRRRLSEQERSGDSATTPASGSASTAGQSGTAAGSAPAGQESGADHTGS